MASETADSRTMLRKAVSAAVVVLAGAGLGFVLFARPQGGSPPGQPTDAALQGLTSVAMDAKDNLYVGGRFGVKVFSPDGTPLREWKTPEPVCALAVDEGGQVYAGYRARVEKFDAQGVSLLRWGRGGCDKDEFGLITGVAAGGGNVFVADAGARIVYRFREDGQPVNDIGSKEKDPDGLGIILPTPFLDCAVEGGVLLVNNPGRKRVEEYDFEGKRLRFWGKSGWADDEFPGCCNPTNVAAMSGGRVAVSEKGTPRVKVFDRDGRLLKVLGSEVFSPESKGIDLAVDSKGRIHAVDPVAGCVRVFEFEE